MTSPPDICMVLSTILTSPSPSKSGRPQWMTPNILNQFSIAQTQSVQVLVSTHLLVTASVKPERLTYTKIFSSHSSLMVSSIQLVQLVLFYNRIPSKFSKFSLHQSSPSNIEQEFTNKTNYRFRFMWFSFKLFVIFQLIPFPYELPNS